MHSTPPVALTEERLGELAFQFRGTQRDDERRKIADDYAKTVKQLFANGWDAAPPPEDQLPDDYMPKEFLDYWRSPPPTP